MFTAGKALESLEYYVGVYKDGTPRSRSDTHHGRNGQGSAVSRNVIFSDNSVVNHLAKTYNNCKNYQRYS